MINYCGADCENCQTKDKCKGCMETCGSPFGGRCVAAEYIKANGVEAYKDFKKKLMDEINAVLEEEGIPTTEKLFELVGHFVNLEYKLPGGKKVKFLNDKNIYLGTQIEIADAEVRYGVIADTTFILICSYKPDGSEPEVVFFKKREAEE